MTIIKYPPISNLINRTNPGALPKYKTIDGTVERLNRRTLATIFVLLSVISTQVREHLQHFRLFLSQSKPDFNYEFIHFIFKQILKIKH